MRRNVKNSESGIALIMVLGVLAVLLILAVTFAFNMRLEQRAARNHLDYVSADYFAKAGIERAIAQLLYQRGEGYFSGMSVSDTTLTADGINLGRFSVTVTDESGKLNLNHAGNLADTVSHGANEGWTTYEISIEDVLEALDITGGDTVSREIIRYRYGDEDDAGGNPLDHSYNEGFNDDGIDNDGSGDSGDSNDPFWFTPWKPRDDHQPFVAASHLYMVYQEDWYDYWNDDWNDLRDDLTVHSRSGNTFSDDGNLRNMLNINAVYSAEALYESLGGLELPAEARDLAQKAVNIIDYRDKNDWITEFEYDTGETVYGVESILINEVLANSYYDSDVVDPGLLPISIEGPGNSSEPFTISNLAPDIKYIVRIRLTVDEGSPGDIEVTFPVDAYTDFLTTPYNDYSSITSSAAGNIDFEISVAADEDDPDAYYSVSINRVEMICAEFIELVNIGGDDINLRDWEIQVAGGAYNTVVDTDLFIEPGGYVVLTNDEFLFEESYGDGFSTVEINDWNRWDPADVPADFEDITNFPNNGNFDIYLYIEYTDPADYLLADLSIDGVHIEQPGSSPGIGVSREKNDPALRNAWDDNADGGSTPGAHNSRVIGEKGEVVLDGLRAVPPDYPPLVANKHFATIGELFETQDWRNSEIRYAGVRSHVSARAWSGIGAHLTPADAANRLIAGHYIRIDDVDDVRLDRNHGRMFYRVYEFYEDDAEVGSKLQRIRAEDTGEIDAEGTPDISLSLGYFLLVPSSIPGRINVNTASAAVLRGLPGVGDALANYIEGASAFENMGAFYAELEDFLGGDTAAKRQFAPIANLVTVDSDVFKVVSTGYAYGPGGSAVDPVSEKTIEAIVDRGGGSIRILSWKVLD